PIDEETIKYLELTGRPQEQLDRVEAYAKAQTMWLEQDGVEPKFSEYLELDLSTVVPSIAGPKRPQYRNLQSEAKEQFRKDLGNNTTDAVLVDESSAAAKRMTSESGVVAAGDVVIGRLYCFRGAKGESAAAGVVGRQCNTVIVVSPNVRQYNLVHGMIASVSITSCSNSSNQFLMIGPGLNARTVSEL